MPPKHKGKKIEFSQRPEVPKRVLCWRAHHSYVPKGYVFMGLDAGENGALTVISRTCVEIYNFRFFTEKNESVVSYTTGDAQAEPEQISQNDSTATTKRFDAALLFDALKNRIDDEIQRFAPCEAVPLEIIITIERCQYVPSAMGGKSVFSFGKTFGSQESFLHFFAQLIGQQKNVDAKIITVMPSRWKKSYNLIGVSKGAAFRVASAILEALYHCPTIGGVANSLKTEALGFRRVDQAESFLIAIFGAKFLELDHEMTDIVDEAKIIKIGEML